MNRTWEFEALLYKTREGFYVDFPFDGKKEFGTRGSVRVKVWFNGFYYRTSLAPKGDGTHWLFVKKEIRDSIGKNDGDMISVKIERDLDPRGSQMPDGLLWLLENEPETKAVFDNLTPSVKKSLIDSVNSAKTDETRVNNINKIFGFLYKKK